MALQITLVKTPAKVSVSKTTHTFYKQGGTLGRGDANAWVLPDPDKFLSSCHCEILCDANSYFILDLSTNGTFLNNSPEPLGKGAKSPLADGDVFEVGEYRFSAKVVVDQDFAGSSPFASQPTMASSSGIDDIFGGASLSNSSSAFADPFSGGGFLPEDFSLGGDSQSLDPLAVLDNARKTSKNSDQIRDAFGGSMFDPVTGAMASNSPYSSAATDHSPSLDQSISWPESSRQNLIPEDWDDLLAPSSSPQTFNENPRAFQEERDIPHQASAYQGGFQESPQHTQPVTATPVVRPTPQTREQITQTAPVVNVTEKQQIPTPTNSHPTQAVQAQSAPNNRLITAMGLDATRLTPEQIDEISDMVGELMRETVGGMMQVLRSRTSIKNEFRMNVTTIQPVENNPLKFSVGVDDALENMFIKKTNAYKKPVDAFREGFQEIGEHQVAVIAGIRHGFERMMDRFNPEMLEQNFNKHGKGGSVIPGMQKAKYWSNYTEHYAGFVDNMESSFQHLFGGDFVNAYEDQLRKLAAARKKIK